MSRRFFCVGALVESRRFFLGSVGFCSLFGVDGFWGACRAFLSEVCR